MGPVAAIVLAVAGAGAPATAHEVTPGLLAVLDEPPAALDGIEAQVVVSAAPQLVLAWRHGPGVEVLDGRGRAFLRIGPDGVHADLGATAWHEGNDPLGRRAPPAAPPRWRRVSAEPSWGWFDHRLHPAGAPPATGRWRVPLRRGGSVHHLRGRRIVHGARGRLHVTVGVADEVPGLRLHPLAGTVPLLVLSYSGPDEIVLLGRAGEPFLRVGPGGVAANAHSPSWREAALARGETVTAPADPAAPPAWHPVATAPRYAWLDSRAAPPAALLSERLLGSGGPAHLMHWTLGIRTARGVVTLRGSTQWLPDGQEQASRSGVAAVGVLALALGAIGLVGGGLVLRRRRR